MEQTVTVTKLLDDGVAQVRHVRQSACSGDCHKCSGCGAATETLSFSARNPIGAKPGDKVIVQSDSKGVLLSAAVQYVLPLVLFFVMYSLGTTWDIAPAALGSGGFALGIILAVVYGKHLEKTKKTEYTITGFAG